MTMVCHFGPLMGGHSITTVSMDGGSFHKLGLLYRLGCENDMYTSKTPFLYFFCGLVSLKYLEA